MMNNQRDLLTCCNFKCDEASGAVISGCADRLGVLHHGFLFMFPTVVKPVGEETPTNQSRPSEMPLLGNQEAVRALMKRCHSLGLHKRAVDNWLPAANVNLLIPQPAGFFPFLFFIGSEMFYRSSNGYPTRRVHAATRFHPFPSSLIITFPPSTADFRRLFSHFEM